MAGNLVIPHTFAADVGPEALSLLDGNFSPLVTALNTLSTFANNYVDSGAVNAIVVTVSAPQVFAAYTDGVILNIKVAATNTSQAVTINVNGLGAKALVYPDGSLPAIGKLVATGWITVEYESSVGRFHLLGGGAPGVFGPAPANTTAVVVNGNNGTVPDFVLNSTGSDSAQSLVVTGNHNGTIAALVQNLSTGAAAGAVSDLGVSNNTLVISQLGSGATGVPALLAGGFSGQQALITTSGTNEPLALGANSKCGMLINAAQTLGNALDISARGVGICRFKAADTSRASTIVLANDPDLTFAISAAGTYLFQLLIGCATPGATGLTPGLAFEVNFSGTATGAFTATGFTNVALQTAFPLNTTSGNVGLFGSNTAFGAATVLLLGAIKVTAAGTLAFQWAQGVSSANATTVNAGSYLIVTQLS